jgi:hypothetical protein
MTNLGAGPKLRPRSGLQRANPVIRSETRCAAKQLGATSTLADFADRNIGDPNHFSASDADGAASIRLLIVQETLVSGFIDPVARRLFARPYGLVGQPPQRFLEYSDLRQAIVEKPLKIRKCPLLHGRRQ